MKEFQKLERIQFIEYISKIELKESNINCPDYNISGTIPGIDIDKLKIDLKTLNLI